MNKQIPPYKDLASTLEYTGPEKFHNFVQYCLNAFKVALENELAQNFSTNALRTNLAFDRVGTWTHFYGQTDLQKDALKIWY